MKPAGGRARPGGSRQAAGQRGSAAPFASPSTGSGLRLRAGPFSSAKAGSLQGLPVEFVGSFPDPLVRLEPERPEIAFIGRSNVGKSSLLNALVGRAGLARVSASPGKTTLLNAFRLPGFYLVDLPGYGYARAGKAARAGYHRLVTRFLRQRPTLTGVVWLLDIRHDPSKEDRETQRLLVESGRPVLAVLTKADKLTHSARATRTRELAAALGLQEDQVQPTSSKSGLGISELAESILAAAGGAG